MLGTEGSPVVCVFHALEENAGMDGLLLVSCIAKCIEVFLVLVTRDRGCGGGNGILRKRGNCNGHLSRVHQKKTQHHSSSFTVTFGLGLDFEAILFPYPFNGDAVKGKETESLLQT